MSAKRTEVFRASSQTMWGEYEVRRLAAVVRTAAACRRRIEIWLSGGEIVLTVATPAPQAVKRAASVPSTDGGTKNG